MSRTKSPPRVGQDGRSAVVENQGTVSMSVAETNDLRAKLGLAPLRTGPKKASPEEEARVRNDPDLKTFTGEKLVGELILSSRDGARHVPADNISEKSAVQKMRDKLEAKRQKRKIEAKLLTNVKMLGDSDSDGDDAAKWVLKQKKAAKAKAEAERRAKALAEMDDEFGVAGLVEEDAKKQRQKRYGEKQLAGLKVEHSTTRFEEGRTVVLTLKDQNILDEDGGDTLVNVNIVEDERRKKAEEEVKKARSGYNAYDDGEVDEMNGETNRKNMLAKYDEEIEGEKKSSFALGQSGEYNEEEEKLRQREIIRKRLNATVIESLQTQQKVASDYFTAEETITFKKPKKKVKKKILKADDLLGSGGGGEPSQSSFRSRTKKAAPASDPSIGGLRTSLPMDVDAEEEEMTGFMANSAPFKVEAEDADDVSLQSALGKARRMKQLKDRARDQAEKVAQIAAKTANLKEEHLVSGAEFIQTFEDDKRKGKIIMNETSEFCRNLGAWQSSEASDAFVKEEVHQDLLEFEESLTAGAADAAGGAASKRGQWEEVAADDGADVDRPFISSTIKAEETILDEEPDLNKGVAAAIKLANNKNYWEQDALERKTQNLAPLMAQNYSIDDKARTRDDSGLGSGKRGGRERSEAYAGPTMPFTEKKKYKPIINLEYIDNNGRLMDQKEAFRHLSHRFHGKGSGKMKTEKRYKKAMEESMMKNMNSTDTPLNTASKLRERQKESQTPYVVITGNKINSQADVRK